MKSYGLLFCVLWTAVAHAQTTRTVRTAAELRKAAEDFYRTGFMNIIVEGRIDLEGKGVGFTGKPNPDPVTKADFPYLGTVTLMRGSSEAVIVSNMKPPSDTIDWSWPPANVFEFNCENITVMGLTFDGYEWEGAVVKASLAKSFSVIHSTFKNISQKTWPSRGSVQNAGDVWTGQCVVGGGKNCDVWVLGCKFVDCGWADTSYCHCIYVGGRTIKVIGNEFRSCTSPMQLGTMPGANVMVVNNIIHPSRPSPFRGDKNKLRPPFVLDMNPSVTWTVVGNVLEGPFSTLYVGSQVNEKCAWIGNDYTAATWDVWSAIPLEEWKKRGLDTNSKFPGER